MGGAGAGAEGRSRASQRRSCRAGGRRAGRVVRAPRPRGDAGKDRSDARAKRSIAANWRRRWPRMRRANGGAMRVADLAAHQPDWVGTDRSRLPRLHDPRDPAERPGHRRADRAGHPRALRHGRRSPVDSADSLHLQIEAVKLAFADALALRRRRRLHALRTRATARRGLSHDRCEADRQKPGASLSRQERPPMAARYI